MEDNVTPMLKDADRIWIAAHDPQDREAALAFIHWKRKVGIIDRLSRPRIFIEAYQLGKAVDFVMKQNVITEEKPTNPEDIA